MPLTTFEDESTLNWCPSGTSHYQNQCWLRSMLPCAVSRPQWVNTAWAIYQYKDSIVQVWVSIIKKRQSWDHLIFIMWVPILVRWYLHIETAHWSFITPLKWKCNSYEICVTHYLHRKELDGRKLTTFLSVARPQVTCVSAKQKICEVMIFPFQWKLIAHCLTTTEVTWS